MALLPAFTRKMPVLFHTFGLSCLGVATFLQTIVFIGIAQQGCFMAIEQNKTILSFEVALTALAIIYFVYIYQQLIRSVK